MSYSFNIKGKIKIEPELARDVANMLKDIEIEFERPKKSIFEIEDEGVLEEAELNELTDVLEHVFEYIVSDIDQSIFLYIHELDPVDREIVISENRKTDLMTKSDCTSHIIFIEKGLMKNTKKVITEIDTIKDEIINMLEEKQMPAKWVDMKMEEDNPFILPVNYKIKIKGGNKGIFISTLLDEDLHCENYEEIFQINNDGLKEKFSKGYMGIRVTLRAFSSDIEYKAAKEIANFLKEKFNGFHSITL